MIGDILVAIDRTYSKFSERYAEMIKGEVELTERQKDMVYAAYRAAAEIYEAVMQLEMEGWEDG